MNPIQSLQESDKGIRKEEKEESGLLAELIIDFLKVTHCVLFFLFFFILTSSIFLVLSPFPSKPSYSCPTEGVVQIGTSEGIYLDETFAAFCVVAVDSGEEEELETESEFLSRGAIF